MATFVFLTIIFNILCKLNGQTLQWYGLEPYAKKPMISMFTAIYDDRLYLVGGPENSVTTLNLNNIYMNDYDQLLYQPDLNVKNAEWTTKSMWYTLNYGLFCNQSCSTQINYFLYIVAPFKNFTNKITKTSTLYIYNLYLYRFFPTNQYRRTIPRDAEYSCVVNNNTHLFIIGGGHYSDKLTTYDITNNKWTEMNGHLNIGRINFGCSFNANMSIIFVFGGDTAWNASTSTIEQYILDTDEWLFVMLYDTSTMSSDGSLVKLSFKRSRHNCVLDTNSSNIYIFGGGGCSEINNVCTAYRNLVEIFDTVSYKIWSDEALLLSAISDSYSSNYYRYVKDIGGNTQSGSWFDGIFVIGGKTENKNATFMVQYRITNFEIFENVHTHWIVDNVSKMVFVLCGLLLLVVFAGFIFSKVKKYTDTRLLPVVFWFLYLMDVMFDVAFNRHLWMNSKYGLASFALLFIICRIIYSIGWQLRLGLKKWKNDITIRERVNEYLLSYMSPCCQHFDGYGEDNEWFLYFLALLSGSSHGLIHLLNSNLFGLHIFNMGLVDRHMIEYNLSRLPSGLLVGNIPQFIIQILYVLEWGSEHTTVLYAGSTTFISIVLCIIDIFIYRHSFVPVRTLMLEQDFTKPFFLIFKSEEIYSIRNQLIHKSDKIIEALSQMIDVTPDSIEINLCQIVPKGIKISFVEYSGTKNTSEITRELTKSVENGWFQSAIKTHWKLSEKPLIEIWDEQQMYDHKQFFTQDLIVNMNTLLQQYGDDKWSKKCYQIICCSCCGSCCTTCADMLRVSSMR